MLGWQIAKVNGLSMSPRVPDNSFVVVCSWFNFLPIKVGQVLKFNHPKYGELIKTVSAIDKYGFLWFCGENEHSISIEEIGPVNKNQVSGKVCLICRQP